MSASATQNGHKKFYCITDKIVENTRVYYVVVKLLNVTFAADLLRKIGYCFSPQIEKKMDQSPQSCQSKLFLGDLCNRSIEMEFKHLLEQYIVLLPT